MVWGPSHHRLLGPASPPTATITAHDGSEPRDTKDNNIDSNMVIILGVLLFALLCALGLNSVIRCLLRCTITRHPHHHNRREVGPRGGTTTFIGAAARGLKRSTIRQIPTTNYHTNGKTSSHNNNNSNSNNNNVMSSDCMICLGEFIEGEKIKVLPKCKHGFHSKCIDTWLLSHSTCPNCRQSLLEWAGNTSGAIVVPMAYENHANSSHNDDGSSGGGDATQTRH